MVYTKVGSNQNVIRFNNGTEVLFSYETPVAGYSTEVDGTGWFRTEKHFSATTSKHINKWLGDVNATEVKQSFIEGLVDGTSSDDDDGEPLQNRWWR